MRPDPCPSLRPHAHALGAAWVSGHRAGRGAVTGLAVHRSMHLLWRTLMPLLVLLLALGPFLHAHRGGSLLVGLHLHGASASVAALATPTSDGPLAEDPSTAATHESDAAETPLVLLALDGHGLNALAPAQRAWRPEEGPDLEAHTRFAPVMSPRDHRAAAEGRSPPALAPPLGIC